MQKEQHWFIKCSYAHQVLHEPMSVFFGVHLPEPSSYGNSDSYEGFAFIPDEISWRFKLYPSPEKDSPTWAGRFDEITAKMINVEVQVRLSYSKTEKLGSILLKSNIKYCK